MAIDRISFNASWAAYLIFKTWQLNAGETLPILDNYFADLLTLPVILPVMQDMMTLVKRRTVSLPLPIIFFTWGYLSFFMEWLAPKWSPFAVADRFDLLAYGFGALFYWLTARNDFLGSKEKGACSSSL